MVKKVLFLCGIMVLFLAGCGNTDGKVSTLVLATFGGNAELNRQVDLFNQTHEDYRIEICEYSRSNQSEEDGIAKLQREIASGNGPDIINFGNGYAITDILGQYTEDLFPYPWQEAEESGTDYFANILEAFSYQDRLYAMPVSFSLKTYAGRHSVIGDRESWSIEDLAACYQKEYEKTDGSLMLYPGETKKDVFGSILTGNVENYVDWENGTCCFNGNGFKKVMEFANQFPETLQITEDFSPMQCFADGKALLYPVSLHSIYDICSAEMILGEDVTYIVYPTDGSDGTVIQAGSLMLAISIGSKHKDAAWEFISLFLKEDYQKGITTGFPINKNALAEQLAAGQETEYREDAEGNRIPVAKSEIGFEGENPIYIYQITAIQSDRLLQMIENASVGSAYDDRLHSMLLEEADSYFNGNKTLDETAEVMQGRAIVYIGENR